MAEIDRKKVICHLYDCMEESRPDHTWVFVRTDIVEDVLSLLKEQEAMTQCIKKKCIICPHCQNCIEELRAKPIHEVIDEGNGYLCNAVFCGNCGAEIYSDKCDKCGTIADESAE